MKRSKIKRIALAAALASTMLASAPSFSLAQTATQLIAELSTQVQARNFAASRALIRDMEQAGIVAVRVGSQRISLEDLLGMIASAESGKMQPAELAAYLDALAENTAQAVFKAVPESTDEEPEHTEKNNTFGASSSG